MILCVNPSDYLPAMAAAVDACDCVSEVLWFVFSRVMK